MGMLVQLRERSGGARGRFGRELRAVYLAARRMARQLRRHGEQVPYPALGADLARLAAEVDGHAAALADELRAVAGNPDPSDALAPRDGHNHWERLTLDLADLESLQRRYTELALRWDVDFPATVATFERLAHDTAAMSAGVRSMIARSDPHAG
jgi:hypothetical protein